MKGFGKCVRAAAAGVLLAFATQAVAVPASPPSRTETTEDVVAIPFAPPIGETLRFRWQKTLEKDGRSVMQWSLDDFRFEKAGEGFRLTVTPVESGSGSEEPMVKAIEQKLADLMRRPIVLTVSADAVITDFENADAYWATVFEAADAVIAEIGKPEALPPEMRAALAGFLKTLREMPDDARLAMLTENVQPLVTFAATEWSSRTPVISDLESPSPFGPLKQEVRIALEAVADDSATLSLHSSIPADELERIARTALAPFIEAAGKEGKPGNGTKDFGSFSHETRARTTVSLDDGLVVRHRSTETIEGGEGSGLKRRVTTVSFDRVS